MRKRSTLVVIVAAALLMAAPAGADWSAVVNVGALDYAQGVEVAGDPVPDRNWNNFGANLWGSPAVGATLTASGIDVDGVDQGFDLEVIAVTGGTGSKVKYSGQSSLYPYDVSYYHWWIGGNTQVTLELSGLDTAKTYDLAFYGGRANPDASWIGEFTVGAASIQLETAENMNQKAEFPAIAPDANGKIAIGWTDVTGTTYLSAIEIAEVPEPATLSLLAIGLGAMLRRRRR